MGSSILHDWVYLPFLRPVFDVLIGFTVILPATLRIESSTNESARCHGSILESTL
jgi:hypothetical protein